MTKEKAIVLLSGGLDSTVNLYEAKQKFDVVQVLTINYAQKALSKELISAKYYSDQLDLPWLSLDLSWVSEVSASSLTSDDPIPDGSMVDITSYETSLKSAKSVWVPNRNGLFLNVAAVFADALNASYVVPGFNKEEAETFPDNSNAFMMATSKAFSFSTRNQSKVYCFTSEQNKTQILKRAKDLNIPLNKLWPCYHSFDLWCGRCESCLRFKRALKSCFIDLSESFME